MQYGAAGWHYVDSAAVTPGTPVATTRFPILATPINNKPQNILMDNPRVLLAIALSFLVLLIWQAWMEDYGPQPAPQASTPTETPAAGATTATTTAQDLPVAPDDTMLEADTPESAQLPAGQQIEVVTDLFHAVINTRGGDQK